MEELLKAIAKLAKGIDNSSIEQQVSLLPQALEYGDSGINFLINRLSDSELEIRAKAYNLLQDVESEKAQRAIAPGLLFNSGDRVYSVYQSGTSFDDSGYYLNDNIAYFDDFDLFVDGEDYFYYHEKEEFCKSKRLFCYLNQDEAEEKAEALHRKLIQKKRIGGLGFEWEPKDSSFEQWCVEHNIDYDNNNWKSKSDVLDYLYLPENIELLSKFWKDGIGRFAFVQEEFIQQKVQLRIEEKLTQRTFEENMVAEFIARPKDHQQKSFNFLVRVWESDRSKTYLLPKFLKYGELGIDFLIKCLEDPELEIRATAYKLLGDVESDKVQNAIALGLLINPGDKIYYIQESTMWFTDSNYFLLASEDSVRHLDTQDDYKDRDYKIVRFDKEVYVISYFPYYTNYQQAKLLATSLQNERILKHSVTEFDLENDRKATKQWCDRHKITNEVSKLQKEKDIEINKYLELLGETSNRFVIYWSTVEEYIKSIGNLDLLNQLWQELVGSMVSLCEVNFVRKTYLTIDAYYSQILDQRNYYIHHAGEDKNEFIGDNLISEKAETRFLLSTLHHSDLATRSLVYQLLKGISLNEAQQAIHQGVKLNSGDKIYSVYQSGVGFDDQMYYMLGDDIDYIEQLHSQINNSYEYDPRVYSQRIYCFTDKKQAKEAAETLHRKLIKKKNLLWNGVKQIQISI